MPGLGCGAHASKPTPVPALMGLTVWGGEGRHLSETTKINALLHSEAYVKGEEVCMMLEWCRIQVDLGIDRREGCKVKGSDPHRNHV